VVDYTPHQKRIIKRYYDHKSTLMIQKLAEFVSELSVEESEAKKRQLWTRVEKALRNLKVPSARIARILESQDVKLLAEVVKDFF
jgi:hypothetical protein